MNNEGDILRVAFQGELIECRSLSDAIAIKTAAYTLAKESKCSLGALALERLAFVMAAYSLFDGARQLHLMAEQGQGSGYLTHSGSDVPAPHWTWPLKNG